MVAESFPSSADVIDDGSGATARIVVDPVLFPEEVALKAAYWLTDRFHVHLGRIDGQLVAEIRTKDAAGGAALAEACGEFSNSLIDFAIRARVAAETRDIHEALLQRAFTELLPKTPD